MEDLREQQVEALQVLKEYNQKLTKSVLLVVEELLLNAINDGLVL